MTNQGQQPNIITETRMASIPFTCIQMAEPSVSLPSFGPTILMLPQPPPTPSVKESDDLLHISNIDVDIEMNNAIGAKKLSMSQP
jgi:hypothetical protein